MTRAVLLVGLAACWRHDAAPRTASPPPAPQRPAITLHDAWPSLAGADIVAIALPGPYRELARVCSALGRDAPDTCETRELDELDRSPLQLGSVRTWEPQASDSDMPERHDHVAVHASAGWFVMPAFAETGNRYSGFSVEPELAGDALVLRYTYDLATSGRFANEVEDGIVVCKAVDRAVACTPKIATHKRSSQMDTSAPDWPSSTQVELACTASYANGAITIAATAMDPDAPELWSESAANACTALAYAGVHRVTF